MEDQEIPPAQLQAINPAKDDKVARLIESMRSGGWGTHRRLLVEEVLGDRDPFGRPGKIAWTGSHRIEAAKSAGLQRVPCRVMTASEMKEHFSPAYGSLTEGFSSWRDVISFNVGSDNPARMRALANAGLAEAAAMMQEEINSLEG